MEVWRYRGCNLIFLLVPWVIILIKQQGKLAPGLNKTSIRTLQPLSRRVGYDTKPPNGVEVGGFASQSVHLGLSKAHDPCQFKPKDFKNGSFQNHCLVFNTKNIMWRTSLLVAPLGKALNRFLQVHVSAVIATQEIELKLILKMITIK